MADPAFLGCGRARELMEMVSALTHVASGSSQRGTGLVSEGGFTVTSLQGLTASNGIQVT